MKTQNAPFQELLEQQAPQENQQLRALITKALDIADYQDVIQMLEQVQYEQFHTSEQQYQAEVRKYDC